MVWGDSCDSLLQVRKIRRKARTEARKPRTTGHLDDPTWTLLPVGASGDNQVAERHGRIKSDLEESWHGFLIGSGAG